MKLDEEQKSIINLLVKIFVVVAILIYLGTLFEEPQTKTEDTKSKIEKQMIGICIDEYDYPVVCGAIKNISNEMLDVRVYVNVYNEAGSQIQDQVIFINNLEPQKEAEFKGYSVPKDAHEAKIVDIRFRKS